MYVKGKIVVDCVRRPIIVWLHGRGFFLLFRAASHLPGRCPPSSPRLFSLEMTP